MLRKPANLVIGILFIVVSVLLTRLFVERNQRREEEAIHQEMTDTLINLATLLILFEDDYNRLSIPSESRLTLDDYFNSNETFLRTQNMSVKTVDDGLLIVTNLRSEDHTEVIFRSGENWFVLAGRGIDRDFELDAWERVDDFDRPANLSELSDQLLTISYDPTNGMLSSGDLVVTSENLPLPIDRCRAQYLSIAIDSPRR